jgi:hypothetical protein
MIFAEDKNLFYTGPISLSQMVADRIRQEELLVFIEKITKIVVSSPSEFVRCFNLDWFKH